MNNRRRFLSTLSAASVIAMTPEMFADELYRTAAQTEGPFYPNQLPLDTDNDLLVINNGITPAVGTVTHLTGRVLDKNGSPIRNAVVEIWQCDNNGVYIHTSDSKRGGNDKNFQGFGRFVTSSKGEYYFRTIKPVPYGPRCPHIHFKIRHGDKELLTTQCYIAGEKLNEKDSVYLSAGDEKARKSLTVDFAPIPDSKIGELAANFEIVLGYTPEA